MMDFFRKKSREETPEERFILSLDGGGMRGIIPAVLLDKLSLLLQDLGDNRPLYSHFDLIAGTSTGGLLALALSAPVERTHLEVDSTFISYLYEQEAPTLFQRFIGSTPERKIVGTLPFGVRTKTLESLYLKHGKEIFPKNQGRIFSQIFIDKYDEEPLERFLKNTFKDLKLEEAIVPTLIMSYDAANGKPFALSDRDSHGFLFWEAARATSAAPTYFKPAFLYDRQEQKMQTLIDGGVLANNPTLYAYSEAKRLYPNAKKFHILSLSTASSDFTFTVSGGTGVIGWIDPAKGAPIQKIYAAAQMQQVDAIAKDIPDISYTRIHGELGDSFKLDATSQASLTLLRQGAIDIYHQNEESIRDFASLLSKRTEFDQLEMGPVEREIPPALPEAEEAEEIDPKSIPALSPYYSFLSRYNLDENGEAKP